MGCIALPYRLPSHPVHLAVTMPGSARSASQDPGTLSRPAGARGIGKPLRLAEAQQRVWDRKMKAVGRSHLHGMLTPRLP